MGRIPLLALAAFGLATFTGCLLGGDDRAWERKARFRDFSPLGDTAFATYLETYSVRKVRGTGDEDVRMGRSGFVVFDRRRRSFRDPGSDIPLSAAHALPMYFLGCEEGRPAWLREPGRAQPGHCTAAGFEASPGASVAVLMGQHGSYSVHDRAMDTLGVLPPLRGAQVLRIDAAAQTVDVLEYGDGNRMQWKRSGFAAGVLDSALFAVHPITVQEAGWGMRVVCAAADSAETAPCWRPEVPGLEAAIRAACSFARCAWDPGSARLLRLDGLQATWIDPGTGAEEAVDWLEPALAWGR